MKLEVGMYVRTKITDNCNNVYIRKITEIDNGKALFNQICIDEDVIDGWGDERIWIDEEDISKASHNLLGNDKEPCLIEVGDIISYEFPTGLGMIGYENVTVLPELLDVLQNGENNHEYIIKSIVTKEQFESMSYKVGE